MSIGKRRYLLNVIFGRSTAFGSHGRLLAPDNISALAVHLAVHDGLARRIAACVPYGHWVRSIADEKDDVANKIDVRTDGWGNGRLRTVRDG